MGYIGIVQHKEHSPEVSSIPPGTPCTKVKVKVKVSRNMPGQAQGVPGRLRPRIFLTFGNTRVVGRQPYAPAAFIPKKNPWYSFLETESTPGHMELSDATEKNPATRGIDPRTFRLVAQWHLCTSEYV